MAKRAATRRDRPDDAGRNHPRGGGGHDLAIRYSGQPAFVEFYEKRLRMGRLYKSWP